MAEAISPVLRQQLMMADVLRRMKEGGLGYNMSNFGPEALKYMQRMDNTAPVSDRGQKAVDIYNQNR